MTIRPGLITSLVVLLVASTTAYAQGPDLTSLHDALHLTPVQEVAWRNYRLAIAPDPAAQARHASAQSMMNTLPTPRRIDLIEAEMAADAEAMHRQGQAVKTFYAALTPQQQQIFDHQTLPSSGAAPPPPSE